ncbi:MAG TPA: DNA-binding protein WhiA [Candidatus Dorea faecipullorum]|nr:DNA-binding protein WhiA [Candidatus Dorea faecipullorum]
MSFSGKVKEELSGIYPRARHCQLAELAALTGMNGLWEEEEGGSLRLILHAENIAVIRKCFTLLEKTFNIKNEIALQISVRRNLLKDSSSYVLRAEGGALAAIRQAEVQAVCCKRAFMRGAFLAAGSMSDPGKSYHFEIVCDQMEKAQYLQRIMNSFELDARIVSRKKHFVIYLKEGERIVDALNIMEAHVALMELENVRILKDMRNAVNRKVNCETANIHKTVSAAVKQLEDIAYIRDTVGFEQLPLGVKDVALTRLAYPEATLKELGDLLETPVGKSGVNHRLRKLSEMADKLRGIKEVHYD